MAIVTHLATRPRPTEVGGIDFEAFTRCKSHLASKDHLIAESLCREILRVVDANIHRPFRLLDVGTGEASLIESVVRRVLTDRPDLSGRMIIDCVEPTTSGDAYCRAFAARASGLEVPVSCQMQTIEEFLGRPTGYYDAIVCCHTLYHIPQEKWREVVEGLHGLLAPTGLLLINLVSRTSDIYRILEELESRLAAANVDRRFEAFGWLYFAEDLIPLFVDGPASVSVSQISAPIHFTPVEVSACALALAGGRGETSTLVQFLAFMFRVQPRDLSWVANDILAALVSSRQEIAFNSTDHLYSIQWR